MVLLVDVGNTNIVIGIGSQKEVLHLARIKTDLSKTESEYQVLLHDILKMKNCNLERIERVIYSSVVPSIDESLKSALLSLTKKMILEVSSSINLGFTIDIDNPSVLGSDLIVSAVYAANNFRLPVVIVDMGTATTLSVLTKDKVYQGALIIPGLMLSLDALSKKANKLPNISLSVPETVVGKNTVHAMQSGLLNGSAAMIDGLVEKIEKEMNETFSLVITGGLARYISPLLKKEHLLDDDLLLKGLYEIHLANIS